MKDILFIGPLDYPNIPKAGDTVKNQLLIKFFREKNYSVDYIDTFNWRKRFWILFEVLFCGFSKRYKNLIYSVSNRSAYRLTWLFSFAPRNKNYFYFMIGGYTPILIKQGKYKAKPFKKLNKIIVEADKVSEFYDEVGITNTLRLYNFKSFTYKPVLPKHHAKKIQFVFLSRLTKLKGVFLILDAVKILNQAGFKDQFIVDFYGAIEPEIRSDFFSEISLCSNVQYKGFLNLLDEHNYSVLSEYDTMLFPTMHPTEGFPGVIVDAAIAGLPVIAANWNYAQELVLKNRIGYVIPVGDLQALVDKMKHVIEHREELDEISRSCVSVAQQFETNNVLTDDFLNKLGL